MPTLSTAVLIARSIVREVIASSCHGGKMSRSWQILVLKISQKKRKWKDDFPVHDCTQEQNGSLYFFFHRSAMQIAVSIEKGLWDPEILLPWYYLTSHFSTLFSVIIAAVLYALQEQKLRITQSLWVDGIQWYTHQLIWRFYFVTGKLHSGILTKRKEKKTLTEIWKNTLRWTL